MRKILLNLIIFLSLTTAYSGVFTDDGTLKYDDKGVKIYDVELNNWTNLKEVITTTSKDTIYLEPGLYNSDDTKINFTQNLHIVGYGAVLNLSSSCSGGGVFVSSTSNLNVTIEGLTIEANECSTDLFNLGSVTFNRFELINTKVFNAPQRVGNIDLYEGTFKGNIFQNVNKGFSVDLDGVDGMRVEFLHNIIINEDYNDTSGSEYGEAIEINSHRDGEAIVSNNYISGFRENSIDGNIGRIIINSNIIYGVCDETRSGAMVTHLADSSTFSSGVISGNQLFNVPINHKGIQTVGYSGSSDYRNINGNIIHGCDGGTSSQIAITSSTQINNTQINNNKIVNFNTGIQVNGDDNQLHSNIFEDVTTNLDDNGDRNTRIDNEEFSLFVQTRFYNTQSYPIYINRNTGSSEYAEIYVDDEDLIIKSNQDETSGFYGNIKMQLDDGSSRTPSFLVENNAGGDLFEVQSDGEVYLPQYGGTSGYVCYNGTTKLIYIDSVGC